MVYDLYLYRAVTFYGRSFQNVPVHNTTNLVVLQPQQARKPAGLG